MKPPSEPLTDSLPSDPAVSYGGIVARGMAWTTLAIGVSRATGFLANLVLGWLLSQGDYGTYAIAIAWSSIILTLRASGIQKLLIQRGEEYDQLAQPLARLSWIINFSAMILLGLLGIGVARVYGNPDVIPLMWILGASLPLGVSADTLRARLSATLRFRELAAVNAGTMMVHQLLLVSFALAGLGPLSFALPMIVVPVLETVVLRGLVGWWPPGRRLDRVLLSELLATGQWIILAGFAAALIAHGSHLVIGKFESLAVTGTFFFGFQLVASVGMMFTTGVYRVLMPTLSRLNGQLDRQGRAYLRMIGTVVFSASPVCLCGTVVTAPLVHWLWAGKWDAAIPVVQWMTALLPMSLLFAVGAATLEARGLWRFNTRCHFLYGGGMLAAAGWGCFRGGVAELAVAIALFRGGFALGHAISVARSFRHPAQRVVRAVLPPWVASVSWAAVVQWGLAPAWLSELNRGQEVLARAIAFALPLGVAYAVWFWRRLGE